MLRTSPHKELSFQNDKSASVEKLCTIKVINFISYEAVLYFVLLFSAMFEITDKSQITNSIY